MAEFLLCAGFLVLATVAVGLLRLLWGPPEDRMMSALLLGTGGIAVALLLGAAEDLPAAVDLALTLALLAAFAAAAFVNSVTEPVDSEDDAEA
jgi:multicomponent Na+:H+ antiporter subunit F